MAARRKAKVSHQNVPRRSRRGADADDGDHADERYLPASSIRFDRCGRAMSISRGFAT
jgi:hypothetical protein